MPGFWSRVEGWLLDLQADRPRMARYVRIAWWISNAFLLLGALLIVAMASGLWSP